MNHEHLIEKACQIGEHLFGIFSPEHECYEMIKMILDAKPTKDYPFHPTEVYLANELELLENELNELFEKLETGIKSAFYFGEEVEANELPVLNIPVLGSVFIFKLDKHRSISLRTSHEVTLEVGRYTKPYLYFEEMGTDYFRVTAKLIEIDFDGVLYIYILNKV
ncbi:hypothetical protein EF405_19035 [Cyclobacteriaceae bacterium YHN15]|nr:hypothetical protein EF405_19035 [Cyclobacteriaceae bacterium YHN15]